MTPQESGVSDAPGERAEAHGAGSEAAAGQGPGRGAASPGPDWLLNQLTVSGPAAEVARFREAASGTGGIPWPLDLDAEEARLFALMAGGGADARALARLLREAIARRHDRLLTRWQEPGGCPLDLHRLVPIPAGILQLGEDSATAQDWLRAHWGTTWPLRHVCLLDAQPERRLRRSARIVYAFWSADWTPWPAIQRIRQDWPQLVVTVVPRYDG